MSLFSTKRTRQAIKHARKQREYLIDNARLQAQGAGMFYFTTNTGSVMLADRAMKTHITVDPQVTRTGKLVPMISVMTENDDQGRDVDIVEVARMDTTPEMTLGRLIHQYA